MTQEQLLQQLNSTYSGGAGTLDLTTLDDPTYVSLFTGLGLPTLLAYAAPLPWQSADTITLNGTLSTPLLGLTNPPLFIQFTPSGEDFILLVDLQLPATWLFGTSFDSLAGGVFNEMALAATPTSALVLASAATTDPQRQLNDASYNAPQGLSFIGTFDSSDSAALEAFIALSGTPESTITTSSAITLQTGSSSTLAFLSLPLMEFSNDTLLGNGAGLDFTLSLGSAMAGGNTYFEAGFYFTADYTLQTTGDSLVLTLTATYTDEADAVLDFNIAISEESSAYPSDSALTELIGNPALLNNSLPSAVQGASAPTMAGLGFGISLSPSLDLTYVSLQLSATLSSPWQIWENIIELDSASFTFTAYEPFGDSPLFDFDLSSTFTLANLELNLNADLSVNTGGVNSFIITGSLPTQDPGSPATVSGFIAGLFGSAPESIPDTLIIKKLDFFADVTAETYSVDIDVSGSWVLNFGISNQLVFEELELQAAYANSAPSGSLLAVFAINNNQFDITLDVSSTGASILGSWTASPTEQLDFVDIAIALGIYNLPNLPPNLDLQLDAAQFELAYSTTSGSLVSFTLVTNFGAGTIVAGQTPANNSWGYIFGMELEIDSLSIDLTDIPVVGKMLPSGETELAITGLRVVAANEAIPNFQPTSDQVSIIGSAVNSGIVVSVDMLAFGAPQTLTAAFGGMNDGTAADAPPGGTTLATTRFNTLVTGDDTAPPPPIPTSASPGPLVNWYNLQRTYGPLQLNRVGYETASSGLTVLLDASVTLSALTLGLNSLQATIPLQSPFKPHFGLGGLNVSFVSGGLTIAGGLLLTPGVTPEEYTGELAVQYGSFGATALGSFTKTSDGHPSLFAYLFLDLPIGGPGFFYITGLAGGFGYNRTLTLPTQITQVPQFPFVAAAMGTINSTTMLSELNADITVEDNSDWVAAGIRFTSYEILTSFAMLEVSFGAQFSIGILGTSTLSFPTPAQGEQVTIIAQATLALEASFSPSQGQVAVQAQLVPPSYVFAPQSTITGGFAFFYWFGSNAHAGDFVVTLGGYNSYFTPPAWYPTVPQLGLNWSISTNMSIKGGLYFAMTPSVMMAGGALNALWQSSKVKAWFDAQSDFLIRYKPFSFILDAQISIGASVTLNLLVTTKTITIHVGVALVLWGPPFGGQATVDLDIIKFTISFGASQPPQIPNVQWTDFKQSLLPQPVTPPAAQTLAATDDDGTPPTQSGVITMSAAAGLTQTNSDGSWVVNPGAFQLSINTQIPSTGVAFSDMDAPPTITQDWTNSFGIGPVGVSAGNATIQLSVQIQFMESESEANDPNNWTGQSILGAGPKGMWESTTNTADPSGTVGDLLLGVLLSPVPVDPPPTASVPQSVLLFDNLSSRAVDFNAVSAPTSDSFDQTTAFTQLGQIDAQSGTRNPILTALIGQGLSVPGNPSMPLFAAQAPDLLAAPPQLRLLAEEPVTS